MGVGLIRGTLKSKETPRFEEVKMQTCFSSKPPVHLWTSSNQTHDCFLLLLLFLKIPRVSDNHAQIFKQLLLSYFLMSLFFVII